MFFSVRGEGQIFVSRDHLSVVQTSNRPAMMFKKISFVVICQKGSKHTIQDGIFLDMVFLL